MSPYTAADSSGVHADVASSRLAKLVSRHQAMSSLIWEAFPLLELVSKAGWTGVGVAGTILTGCMPKSLRSRCLRPVAASTVICSTACTLTWMSYLVWRRLVCKGCLTVEEA